MTGYQFVRPCRYCGANIMLIQGADMYWTAWDVDEDGEKTEVMHHCQQKYPPSKTYRAPPSLKSEEKFHLQVTEAIQAHREQLQDVRSMLVDVIERLVKLEEIFLSLQMVKPANEKCDKVVK